MEEKKPGLMKFALNWGIIYGVASIIFSVLMYIMEIRPTSFKTGLWMMFFGTLILVIVLIVSMKAYRINVLGGSMSYGEAFKVGLFVLLIGTAISSIYSLIFITIIDPEYMKIVMEESIINTEQFLLDRGMPEEQVEKIMEEIANQPPKSPVIETIKGFFIGSVISTIVNLIIAAIMKKKKQVPFEA